MPKSPKLLLWAVDALDFEPQIVDSAVASLGPLASRLGASVQPVYVLTPSQLSVATELSEIGKAFSEQTYRPSIERILRSRLEKIALPSLLPPQIISVETTSTQVAIEELCRYADSASAEAIVVSSHGRRGLGRFFLGSFAEALMSHAHRPIVVTHPGAPPGAHVNGYKKMLLPSDLTPEGHRYFLEAARLARRLGMEMHILHCDSRSVEPILQSGVYLLSGGWMPVQSDGDGQIEAVQKTIDAWVDEAKDLGVSANGSIDSLGGGIAETVLRVAAQEKTDLIVMAVQSGPIASAFLGSIPREVARGSRCPVMVLRNPGLKHHQKKRA